MSEFGRNRKGDFDEIVEVGFARDVAQPANVMGLQSAQCPEAVEHHARLGTQDVPAHVEQAAASSVQVDTFRFCYAIAAREGERIDTVKVEIVAASYQAFKLGNHTRAPGPGLLHLGHLAIEKALLDF